MKWLDDFRARRLVDRDLAEEIQLHLAERIEDLTSSGMSPDEAARIARGEFGNPIAILERGRDVWRHATIDNVRADLRYALRQFRRAPAFTLAVVLTLALSIGANTAVFTIVNGVLLRPLPFDEPDRLVSVQSLDTRGTPHPTNLSYPTFFDFRRADRLFEQMVCYHDTEFTLTGLDVPVHLAGAIVSADPFAMLGVTPAIGRGFQPADERPGVLVAALSYELWVNRFGADPAIVGKPITLGGVPYDVIGVAPRGFNFPLDNRRVQIWTTIARDATTDDERMQPVTEQRGARMLDVMGRLKPGVPLAQAQAEMDSIAAALAAQYPDQNGRVPATYVKRAVDRIVGTSRAPLLVLFAAVAMVLLIACANLANLLLARTTDRARELAMRLAIGAGRTRIVQQIVTENLLLALFGTVAGSGIAWITVRSAVALVGTNLPRVSDIGVDTRVLAFSVGLTFVTACLFSIPAAFGLRRVDVTESLKTGGRASTEAGSRIRGALVVAQIALGLVLVSGATLLATAFVTMLERDPGFRPDGLLTFSISVPRRAGGDAQQIQFVDQLLERLRTLPGVAAAAAGSPLPLTGHEMTVAFDIEERRAKPIDRPRADMAIVTPGYFKTIGTPIIDGRDFSNRDDDRAVPVLVVNQAFADRFFPGQRAVGKRIEPGATGAHGTRLHEIVGIVGNAKQSSLDQESDAIYYFAYRQLPWFPPSIVVRTDTPQAIESSIRSLVAGLDREVPVFGVSTMNDMRWALLAAPRFLTTFFGAFAAIALTVSAVGLYGVLAYAVAKRTREIGVRIALGATSQSITVMVLRRAAILVGAGLVVGGLGAAISGHLLSTVLPGLVSHTASQLALTLGIVLCTAALAAYLPARRAASVDPITALHID
jgi:putative ABC transport system permease protein